MSQCVNESTSKLADLRVGGLVVVEVAASRLAVACMFGKLVELMIDMSVHK